MTNLQKAAFATTVIGILGLVVSRFNNSSDDILGIKPKTVDKIFLVGVILGGVILTVTSIKEMKKG